MVREIDNLRWWNYKGKLIDDVFAMEMDVNYCILSVSLTASMYEVRPS